MFHCTNEVFYEVLKHVMKAAILGLRQLLTVNDIVVTMGSENPGRLLTFIILVSYNLCD